MKISKNWLQNFFDEKLPTTGELADAITFHAFEIDGVEQLAGGDVLDVKVTPNRGHDCLSYRGIAKEVSAILKIPLAHDPFAAPQQMPVAEPATSEAFAQAPLSVSLEDPTFCRRYIAVYLKGVKVAPSPAWLKKNLEAMGQRSINNVVDATNFVMFNTGQPLHAFDAKKLGNLSLGVRAARDHEEIEALDHKKYALNASMHVVTAGDVPVAIAGIKGGLPCAIDESTTDVVIESANFAGAPVRRAAAALKLRTDASARFEQEISPELAAYAMQNCIEVIQNIAGGELVGVADVYPAPQQEARVKVSVEKINGVLGSSLTPAEVADVFSRLGFSYKEEGEEFEVVIPFERLDLAIPEDLVEEVGRIIGYDKIKEAPLPPLSAAPEVNKEFLAAERAREELVARGYSEVFTSVFAEEGERAVLNKIDSVRPFMRTTLVDGLEWALKKNIPNKDLLGLKEIKLFEIGTVWKGGREVMMLGTVTEKEKASEKPLEPQSGSYEEYALSPATQYKPFSKYPYIVRDIALWVPKKTAADSVEAVIKTEAGELAQRVALFDRFEKGEKVSLAFRIVFQSFERTLTEAEANAVMEKVSNALKAKGFEIR